MIKSLEKQGKAVNRQLMSFNDLECNFKETIEDSILELKRLNYAHWKSAKKYSQENVESKLDHYLKTDSVLFDKKNDIWITIDWCLDYSKLIDKVKFHSKMKSCYDILNIDYTAVVYVKNELAVPDKKLSKFVFNALKTINKEVVKKSYQGGLTIDAKDLI